MRKPIIFLSFIFLVSSLQAQDLVSRIVKEICSCIDTIENMDSLQIKLNDCAPNAIAAILEMETEDQEFPMAEDSVQKIVNSVRLQLTPDCPKIRAFILGYNKEYYYSMSGSETANDLYLKGSEAYDSGDFKGAIKQFVKAIKEDPEFIFALDDLALTYRKLGKYKQAVSYYGESLDIYPEGSFALLNQAVAYTYMKKYNNALMNYRNLIELYPDDPEGYYGVGKVLTLIENYESALDFVFYAHKIYASQNSEYVKDTEDLTSIIYNKLKEVDKLEIFNQKAEEFGIDVN